MEEQVQESVATKTEQIQKDSAKLPQSSIEKSEPSPPKKEPVATQSKESPTILKKEKTMVEAAASSAKASFELPPVKRTKTKIQAGILMDSPNKDQARLPPLSVNEEEV